MATYREVMAKFESLLSDLNGPDLPCVEKKKGRDYCMKQQEEKGRHWAQYVTAEMCPSCAAYWFVSAGRSELLTQGAQRHYED